MTDTLPRAATAATAAFVLSAALTAGCNGSAGDLPEWSPADHTNNDKAPPAAASAAASGSAVAASGSAVAASGNAAVANDDPGAADP